MAQSEIDELHWELIVDRLHLRRCIPFLGAGANISSEAREYVGLPLGGEVARSFARLLKYDDAQPVNLARVTLEFEVRSDRDYLMAKLTELLAKKRVRPSPALTTLARLPLGLVVTANYDTLLERALRTVKPARRFEKLVQPAAGFEDTEANRNRFAALQAYQGPIIYKIHGTFADTRTVDGDGDDPVILTEDDYIEFLTVHEKQTERIGVPSFVRMMMTPSTLLFLGYSLEDWDFRSIFRGLVKSLEKHSRRTSFAIQRSPDAAWVKYWEKQGVVIYDMDVYDFTDELLKRYRKKYPKDVAA